jgi:hypothetical protein
VNILLFVEAIGEMSFPAEAVARCSPRPFSQRFQVLPFKPFQASIKGRLSSFNRYFFDIVASHLVRWAYMEPGRAGSRANRETSS